MSHELTLNEAGQIEFAFNAAHGQAWHGLGQAIEPDQVHDVDHWKQQAGMNWRIQRSRIRYASEQGDVHTWDDNHVLFRSDSKQPLGLVSSSYKVVQPTQVVEFFRDLVEAGGMTLSAMGTLQGGRRFWATAQIAEEAPLSVRDRIGAYVLLSTSADGSLATEARLTTIRVVCANTLAMARQDGKAAFRLSHRSTFDPARVKSEMGLNLTAWQAFKRDMTRLANKPLFSDQVEDLTAQILAGSDVEEAKSKIRESNRAYQRILDLFNGQGKGSRLDGVYGTAWGLVNAFTEFADHHAQSRTDENRFISAQWGPNADLKTAAFQTLLAV